MQMDFGLSVVGTHVSQDEVKDSLLAARASPI